MPNPHTIETPGNPIAFNPDTMTVSQVKECAETLKTVFDGIERGVPMENIFWNLQQAREQMLKRWGAAK